MQYLDYLFWLFLMCLVSSFFHYLVRSILIVKSRNVVTSTLPFVSIIVAARNEFENLQKLIPSIRSQTYQNFELIICLDRCSDQSLDYLKKIELEFDKLRIVIVDELPDHFSPKKYALTLGIKKARYDWLLFTDADCIPATDKWIESWSKKMTDDKSFILGFSPYYKFKGFLNSYIQFETFTTAFEYLSSALMKIPYMGVGRNMAYKKDIFLKNLGYGKFQGIMGGDDDLFVNKLATGKSTTINLGGDSLTFSNPKENFSLYWKQKVRHYSVSKFYSVRSKMLLTSLWILTFLLWVSFIILAFETQTQGWVISLFVSYLILKASLHWWSSTKMGAGYNFWLLPLLEIIHTVVLPVFVTISTATKKIKWK